MNHLYLLFVCCISLEILNRTKFFLCFKLIGIFLRKSFHLVASSKISDHWKSLVLPKYSLLIIKHSSRALFTIILIICLFCFFYILNTDFFAFIISWAGLFESVFFITFYYFLNRNRLVNE